MFMMNIFGISIVVILGIINFFLIAFQLLTGLHIIKVRIKIHRTTGIVLAAVALVHGILGIFANL